MKIKFKLNGVERIINSSKDCFVNIDPYSKNESTLGYHSTFGSALLSHIRHGLRHDKDKDPQGNIEIKDYLDKFNELCEEVRNIDFEVIKSKSKNKSEINIPDEDQQEDEDDF